MNEKRLKKFQPLKQRRDLFLIAGDADAPVGLISWGSVAGVALEALQLARAAGLRVKLLAPQLVYPVSEEIYRDFFASVQAGLVVEQSHQGQLYRVIRMFVDMPAGVTSMARSGANPILASEVLARVREMAMELQRRRAPELQVDA
jgi:2-oxoglutarate ferredoxin oxidoreductase subunit alpha